MKVAYWKLSALLAMGAVLAACGGPNPEGGKTAGAGSEPGKNLKTEGGKTLTIYLLPKKKGVPYFNSCDDGAQEAAKELGDVKVIYDGPADGDPAKAANMIETWTLKGADVIAVSPDDPPVVASAMKKAMAKGISVITWDADGEKDSRSFLVNQASPKEIGYALVDAMAKDLGGDNATGDVAIVTAKLTSKNQNDWIVYIKERLQKYPKLNLVATKPSGEDQQLAFSVTQDMMKAYPNLKGIFALSSMAFPGAADAIYQGGHSGKIMVTGLSGPNDMRKFVKNGTVKSVVLWDTRDLGYLTVYVARAVAKGELKAGATTFKAGHLGEKKVEGDNVMLGGIMVFTKDNIDKYNF
jgi:rhamnose transport system substrate-binding protein